MRGIWQISGVVIVALAIIGCKANDRTELFEVAQVVDFTIQPGLNVVETHFFLIGPLTSPYRAQIEATAADTADVGSIEPKYCDLRTVFSDVELDFIRAIEVYVFDPFDPNFRREVFYLDPVPQNTKTVLRPFPGLSDVKEIISQPTYGIEIRLRFWYPTPQELDMRLSMEFGAFEG